MGKQSVKIGAILYALIEVRIKDADKFKQYAQGTTPTVTQYGGRTIQQFEVKEVLEGDSTMNLFLIQ